MLYELEDTSKVKHLFEGWDETLIYSCLQKVMGKIFVTDPDFPVSAMAYVGCFAFYAGVPDKELVKSKPDGFVIMTPQNERWADCIFLNASRKRRRYPGMLLKKLLTCTVVLNKATVLRISWISAQLNH